MDKPVPGGIDAAATGAAVDAQALIAALNAAGAARFDPVRWRYVETLAQRAGAHQGSVRQMLDLKLMQALQAFQDRFGPARSAAGECLAQGIAQFPQAAQGLQQQFDAGDFAALQRLAAGLAANREDGVPALSLGALVRQLDRPAPDMPAPMPDAKPAARPELKTIRQFRNTWSKLSTDKQVARALAQAPANAGPINSHMLVLRSLALMREISPDYLNRFISCVDTLLCLEQVEKDKPAAVKKPAAGKAAKR